MRRTPEHHRRRDQHAGLQRGQGAQLRCRLEPARCRGGEHLRFDRIELGVGLGHVDLVGKRRVADVDRGEHALDRGEISHVAGERAVDRDGVVGAGDRERTIERFDQRDGGGLVEAAHFGAGLQPVLALQRFFSAHGVAGVGERIAQCGGGPGGRAGLVGPDRAPQREPRQHQQRRDQPERGEAREVAARHRAYDVDDLPEARPDGTHGFRAEKHCHAPAPS